MKVCTGGKLRCNKKTNCPSCKYSKEVITVSQLLTVKDIAINFPVNVPRLTRLAVAKEVYEAQQKKAGLK